MSDLLTVTINRTTWMPANENRGRLQLIAVDDDIPADVLDQPDVRHALTLSQDDRLNFSSLGQSRRRTAGSAGSDR